jgi:hypothetical protein
LGQTVNAHVQEAAEGQPQSEERQCQCRVHFSLCLAAIMLTLP